MMALSLGKKFTSCSQSFIVRMCWSRRSSFLGVNNSAKYGLSLTFVPTQQTCITNRLIVLRSTIFFKIKILEAPKNINGHNFSAWWNSVAHFFFHLRHYFAKLLPSSYLNKATSIGFCLPYHKCSPLILWDLTIK